jgi:ornithine decarboxylase
VRAPSHGLREALGAAETDRLVYDLTGIEESYDALVERLPGVEVRFAVKACPVDEVIAALEARGAGVDAASTNEIAQALRLGVPAHRIHFGNTIKADRDIADAYAAGVRDFATDSTQDVAAIAARAPGSRVFCRIATTGEGAQWGLSRKFGCSVADAVKVLDHAHELGLVPAGLSAHVGSQQMRPEAWQAMFEDFGRAISTLSDLRLGLEYVNLGGGLPALGYLDRHGQPLEPPLDKIFATLREGMQHLSTLSASPLRFLIEPGRHLVADHGAIRAHVQRLSERELIDGRRQHWLYLSVGKFNGLYEMDALQFRLVFPARQDERAGAGLERPRVSAVVAGPTCDSDDAFADAQGLVEVPADLESGEPVWILSCGAYATSYSTRGFNGIDPLPHQWTRSPRVRPIEEADWESIGRIEDAAYASLGLCEGPEVLRAWGSLGSGTCLALEVGAAVAGYVIAFGHPAGSAPALGRPREPAGPPAESENLHLHDLALAPPYRGKGLAKLLLRRLEREAAARGFATIGLVAVGDGAGFWAACGFAPRPEVALGPDYGRRAIYMTRAVEVDQLVAHP